MSLIQRRRQGDYQAGEREEQSAYLRESYPAVSDSVPAAREAIVGVATAAGATEDQIEAVRLAASEALTNVVNFAYPARAGHIHVTAHLVAGGELWVLIADAGCGLHAGRESDGLGLGLALIAQVTDGFAVVERSLGGTELRMRFDLTRTRSDAPARPQTGAQSRGSVSSARRPA